MPRKKNTAQPNKEHAKIVEHPTPRQGITSYYKSSFKWAESYTSLLMGVVVIIVAVLFVVSLIRATHHIQQTTSTATGPAPSVTPSLKKNTYTVKSGDDLWHIAESVYGSGYNWVDIAKANNLSDPGMLFAGDQLILPNVAPKEMTAPAPVVATGESSTSIKGSTYTVVSGDNLWDIALRAYADGYKWVDIAKANNLSNPGLIFSGNVLKIPR